MKTVTIVKLAVLNGSDEVLMLKRGLSAPNRPGGWDFPGGHVELGESIETAVVRELHEETGLIIQPHTMRLYYGHTEIAKYTAGGDNQEINVIRLMYWTRLPAGAHDVNISHEHDAYQWTALDQVSGIFPHPVFGASVDFARQHDVFTGGAARKIDAKTVVIRADGKALLMTRALDDTDRPGDQDFPGGGVDEHEDFTAAAVREAREEAGLAIDPAKTHLFYADTEFKNGRNSTRLVYWTAVDNPEVSLSFEHIDYQWVALDQVPVLFNHRVYGASVAYALANNIFEEASV